MSKRTQITAYGAPSDREKLHALAVCSGKSDSEWVIHTIREQHAAVFGGVTSSNSRAACGAQQ